MSCIYGHCLSLCFHFLVGVFILKSIILYTFISFFQGRFKKLQEAAAKKRGFVSILCVEPAVQQVSQTEGVSYRQLVEVPTESATQWAEVNVQTFINISTWSHYFQFFFKTFFLYKYHMKYI